jgi:hypothetical protein
MPWPWPPPAYQADPTGSQAVHGVQGVTVLEEPQRLHAARSRDGGGGGAAGGPPAGTGSGFDGVLLVPAFLEAGRLTAADIHWAASTRTWSRPARPNSRRIQCPATPHQT